MVKSEGCNILIFDKLGETLLCNPYNNKIEKIYDNYYKKK